MKIISWNVRGLNLPSKHGILKRKIIQQNPAIIYHQETKCSTENPLQLMTKLWKGIQSIVIDSKGASGCIEIIWNLLIVSLNNLSSTAHSISSYFHLVGTNIRAHLMNVYGPCWALEMPLFAHSFYYPLPRFPILM